MQNLQIVEGYNLVFLKQIHMYICINKSLEEYSYQGEIAGDYNSFFFIYIQSPHCWRKNNFNNFGQLSFKNNFFLQLFNLMIQNNNIVVSQIFKPQNRNMLSEKWKIYFGEKKNYGIEAFLENSGCVVIIKMFNFRS